MKTKNLLKPKRYVNELSKDKIDAEPLFWLIGMTILTFVMPMFAFKNDFTKLVGDTLAPLQQISGPEKLSVWFNIFTGLVGFALLNIIVYTAILIILNALVKVTLKLFKKEVSLWKLLNISIYAILTNKFLFFIFAFLLILLTPFLKNIPENQTNFIALFPLLFNIATFILYCYGVAWATKNKFIPF